MSNLSDLLPAGASAKQITATDSGSGISSKAPVILNSDGTVTGISETTDSAAVANLQTVNAYNANSSYSRVCYAATEDRFVLAYSDSNNSNYLVYRVGTMSGGAITWTTPTVIDSNAASDYIDIIYHNYTGKLVLAYSQSANDSFVTIGEFGSSPYTSITWGTRANALSTGMWFYTTLAEWQGTDKFVIQGLYIGGNWQGYARVGTISGSTFSVGTEITWTAAGVANLPSHADMVYDTNIGDQMLLAYAVHSSSATNFATQVLTLSGTDVTSTTPQSVSTTTAGTDTIGLAWDTDLKQALLIYGEEPEDSYGIATSYVVVISTHAGYTTVNTPINFASVAGNQYAGSYRKGVVYDSSKKRFALTYLPSTLAQQMTEITVSGTTPSFSGTNTAVGAEAFTETVGSAFDSNSGKMVVVCSDKDASNYLRSWVYTISGTSSNLTAQAFVGVADSAISASAAGSIIVQGGTVSGPTTSVAVAENIGANIPWGDQTKANYTSRAAYGSDDVLIAYSINDGVTVGARVVAGTIGGGTISFGTDAVISADASVSTSRYTVVYDSTNDTYIVSWLDAGDSYKMYAAVVSLTGNSISFGGTTAIVTTANASNFGGTSSVYDPDTQRVIFTYCSTVDNYAYAVVCEVSSTAITTVGTPAKIDSSSANNGYANRVSVCYDTTENKVIASYSYLGGGGTYYLRAAAGTVTGGVSNSITWGSSVPVISGEGTFISSAYNATDQRVVFSYQSATLTGYLNSSVASVSGTTITVGGTVSVITTGTNYYSSVAHDATANKMVTYYRGAGGPFVASGAINTATNTITYSTPTQLLSGTRNFEDTLYDPTTEKCILISSGASAGQTSCNIYTTAATLTGQPLTTGTKYYVTTSGGFSSSAGSPSVNAGLAISTTSLLLNGDS